MSRFPSLMILLSSFWKLHCYDQNFSLSIWLLEDETFFLQALDAELEEEIQRQLEFYTLSDDGPNVQIREVPASATSPVTDLDAVPVTN